MNFQNNTQIPVFETIGFRMFSVASIVRLTMFVVDVFIHFHTCHSKDGDSNVLTQILEATFTRRKEVQTEISRFLKPTTEKEYNYSMDVVYGNHFDIDILFFLSMKLTPVLLGPLLANSWKSIFF